MSHGSASRIESGTSGASSLLPSSTLVPDRPYLEQMTMRSFPTTRRRTRHSRPQPGAPSTSTTVPFAVPVAVLVGIFGTASCAAAWPTGPAGSPVPTSPPEASAGSPAPTGSTRVAEGLAVQLADTLSTVQVSGSAQVEVEADQARVSFAVETEAETAEEASRENASRMESVLAALRETELPGLEIETRGYSLQPRYRRPDATGTREIDGFTASNTVVATMDEPSSAGTLIDAGVGAGANRIASLAFLASETEEARLQALRRAVARARSEAEAIAGALGRSLGEPLEVSGGAQQPSPPGPLRMEMALQDASTPVEPGTQTVSASVTIRFVLLEGEP